MGDAPASDAESSKPSPAREALPDLVTTAPVTVTSASEDVRNVDAFLQDRRPFGSLQFQVSEVVGRLEAGVNGQDVAEEENKREPRKISAGFFEPDETGMDEILKVLEDLVIKTDPSCDSMDPPLLPTDAVTRAAILSHSISALFGRLERSHAARLGAHIAAETTRWLSHMFRLADYHAYYHQEQMEGLVKVTKMLLHHRYPRYLEDGALAFLNRLPCIYSCVASPLNVVQHLCRQLGLPLACVRPVPVHPSGRGMDTDALAKLCEEDVAANRTPLLVLGEAGVPPLGCGSHIPSLASVCVKKGLYLHLRGHALALPAASNGNQSFSVADSVTITPGPWFGVPGLPAVTFYRIPEPVATANDQSKGVNTPSSREGALGALSGLSGGSGRLPAMPLWTCLRAAGSRRLARRLATALAAARVAGQVVRDAGLRILEAVSRASACVAFQFAPPGVEKPPPYYDKLNSWLGQVLQREAEMISIEVCETESHGVVLRYCPLEGGAGAEAGADAGAEAGAGALAGALEAQLHVLRATVALREPFRERAAAEPCLRLVKVPGWAGLGGVRYVPASWLGSEDELDALNRQLVDALKLTDGAFSCGEGDDGRACVRFGMVTADTDIEELLELVVNAGKEVEESSRVLTNMTEVLKKGIELASADIERENAERLWQEGLLRRVPVVGRVVQWWAPAPRAPRGRRLHLQHGTLQTTDDIYRIVEQRKEDASVPAEAHAPARPVTETPPELEKASEAQ